VPPLFGEVHSRQEIYALRDRSELPRVQFYLGSLAHSRLEEVLEVGDETSMNLCPITDHQSPITDTLYQNDGGEA
jgi:hypothetical protein